jgi:PAS domain-containing protein
LSDVELEIRSAPDGAKWPGSSERVILRARSLGPHQGLLPGGDREVIKNSTGETTGTTDGSPRVAMPPSPSGRSAAPNGGGILNRIGRGAKQQMKPKSEFCERRWHLRDLLDALPAAIYTTDAAGRITSYNQAAVEFSGRTPEIGSDQWCVTWRLYWPDGRPMAHDECPMARAL